ncbi:hypothetical protein MFUL124B02_04905 [Myxococcus fulvus 124B02]|nr:hypothetical protein MFUL124B02_04905 [Myxococcus fulvus 124B02]
MERRFFSVTLDVYVKGRWYLDDPTDLQGTEVEDIWQFRRGRALELQEKLRIPVSRPGRSLEMDFAGVGLAPVLGARAASVFRDLSSEDVQLFPVEVGDEVGPYYLLNVRTERRCIDDAACKSVQYFTEEDVMPEKAGQYRSVLGLRIDKSKVGVTRAFRLWGYSIPIIVDEAIKDALESMGSLGVKFDEV